MTLLLVVAVIAAVACLVVGLAARPLIGRSRPAQAVPLLVVAALSVSLAAGAAMTAIAVAVVAGLSAVGADGHWSAAELRAEFPVPWWLGVPAGVAVAVLLVRAVVRSGWMLHALVRADRLGRRIRAGGGPIVMLDDESADAFTVAGWRGCVVISRRLFRELNRDERRVLTAHELSHLTHRHHLYVQLADLAAAANPLLRAVSDAVRFGVERWADEDAAVAVGDRRCAGRAVARVAVLRATLQRVAPGAAPLDKTGLPILGVAERPVLDRVIALHRPAPTEHRGRAVLAAGLAVAVLLLSGTELHQVTEAVENASWSAGRTP